jgi:hypothetical protein
MRKQLGSSYVAVLTAIMMLGSTLANATAAILPLHASVRSAPEKDTSSIGRRAEGVERQACSYIQRSTQHSASAWLVSQRQVRPSH